MNESKALKQFFMLFFFCTFHSFSFVKMRNKILYFALCGMHKSRLHTYGFLSLWESKSKARTFSILDDVLGREINACSCTHIVYYF